MRTKKEIEREVQSIGMLLDIPQRGFAHTALAIQQMVLRERLNDRKIRQNWFEDTDSDEDDEDDHVNDGYRAGIRAFHWMRGDDIEPPSIAIKHIMEGQLE